jgi:hypothetical protein
MGGDLRSILSGRPISEFGRAMGGALMEPAALEWLTWSVSVPEASHCCTQ